MRRVLWMAAVAILASTSSQAQELQLLPTDGYGSLSGKITLKGDLPEVKNLVPAMMVKDAKCCISPKMKPEEKVDLTWIVDPKTRAVANVMVWVVPPKGKFFPTPDNLKDRKKEPVSLDQPHCQYLPRVVAHQPFYIENGKQVSTGQKLTIKNGAGCAHNVRAVSSVDDNNFNKNLPPGAEIDVKFLPTRIPVSVQCDIHPWMAAKVFVFDHPFYALTDKDGKYEIPMVPAGAEITVLAWHEGVGFVAFQEVNGKTLPGQRKTFEKGKKMTLDFEFSAGK